MIEISDENILKSESDTLKYRYTSSDLKVISKRENTEICKNKENIIVFKLVDTINYYYKIYEEDEK